MAREGAARPAPKRGRLACRTLRGADCSPLAPCGGDLDGVWRVADACLEEDSARFAPIVGTCPDSSDASKSLEAAGTVEFEGGIFAVDLRVRAIIRVAFTAACARALGSELDTFCNEYEASQRADPYCVSGDELRTETEGSGQRYFFRFARQ